MSLSELCFNQIIVLFMLVAVGFFCGKSGFIDQKTNSKLSAIVLHIVNPVRIFMSYQREYQSELLKGLLISMLMAALTHAAAIILVTVLYHGKKDAGAIVEKFAAVYSNCGFMGIPLINGIFGSEGVFYLSGYITMFNLFAWTQGIMMFSEKKDMKSLLHAVRSPSVIAVMAGFVLFVCRVQLPALICTAANSIGDMNTPLAMIVAGVTISSVNFKSELKDIRIYRASAIRLIAVPVMTWAAFRWLPVSDTVFITILAASACPSAATCTMFALRFEKEPKLSAMIFAATTLLSAITLPLAVMLGQI